MSELKQNDVSYQGLKDRMVKLNEDFRAGKFEMSKLDLQASSARKIYDIFENSMNFWKEGLKDAEAKAAEKQADLVAIEKAAESKAADLAVKSVELNEVSSELSHVSEELKPYEKGFLDTIKAAAEVAADDAVSTSNELKLAVSPYKKPATTEQRIEEIISELGRKIGSEIPKLEESIKSYEDIEAGFKVEDKKMEDARAESIKNYADAQAAYEDGSQKAIEDFKAGVINEEEYKMLSDRLKKDFEEESMVFKSADEMYRKDRKALDYNIMKVRHLLETARKDHDKANAELQVAKTDIQKEINEGSIYDGRVLSTAQLFELLEDGYGDGLLSLEEAAYNEAKMAYDKAVKEEMVHKSRSMTSGKETLSSVANAKVAYNSAVSEKVTKEADIAKYAADKATAAKEKADYETALDGKNEVITSSKASKEEKETSRAAKVSAKNEKDLFIETKEVENEDHKARVAELKGLLETANVVLDANNAISAPLAISIAEQQTAYDAQTARLNEIDELLLSASPADSAVLSAEKDDLLAKRGDMKAKLAEDKATKDAADAIIAEKTKEITEYTAEEAKRKGEIENNTTAITAEEDAVVVLADEINLLETSIATLEDTILMATADAVNLTNNIKIATEKIALADKEGSDAQARVNTLNAPVEIEGSILFLDAAYNDFVAEKTAVQAENDKVAIDLAAQVVAADDTLVAALKAVNESNIFRMGLTDIFDKAATELPEFLTMYDSDGWEYQVPSSMFETLDRVGGPIKLADPGKPADGGLA